MTLISLLLVLLVERVTTKSKYWQARFYTDKYLQSIQSQGWFNSSSKSWALALIIFVPVIIVYLVVQKFAGGLLEFIISTAILMICVSALPINVFYKPQTEEICRHAVCTKIK
jgi:AmpE protein